MGKRQSLIHSFADHSSAEFSMLLRGKAIVRGTQTSKSAVSRVSKPAGRKAGKPTWKSAIRQVWKPAPRSVANSGLAKSAEPFLASATWK
jgi:hypothetical protein